MNPFKIVVFISGRGSNLRALHQSIVEQALPIEIAAVLSDKSSAGGLEFAAKNNIQTIVVKRNKKQRSNAEFNTALAEAISPLKPDLVVLAGFMRILSGEFISQFRGKIVNIHPSLLPSFKGLNVQQRAIDAGAKITGCSVHYVDEDVDCGPIIGQAAVPVLPNDTEESLSKRILEQEHILLPSVVAAIAKGAIVLEDGIARAADTSRPFLLQNNALLNIG